MRDLIEIRDESPSKLRIPHSKIRKTVSAILRTLGFKKASVSLYLVSDRKIRTLNKKFLGHDWATDVISFSQLEGKKIENKIPALGDLIISLDTTARQAKEYGNDFFYEFSFYVCHGILHLMGYDDQTPKEAKWMEKKQTAVLNKMGMSPVHQAPVTRKSKKQVSGARRLMP